MNRFFPRQQQNIINTTLLLVAAAIFSSASVHAALPGNDDLDAAFILSGNEWTTVGTTVGATLQVDDGEQVDDYNVNYNTVWYRWTAPSTGVARLDFRNSVSSVKANIYTGPAGASFSQLMRIAEFAEIDDYYDQAAFPVMGGTTYYIQVGEYGSWSGDPGTFSMALFNNTSLLKTFPLRADISTWGRNDNFSNAIQLEGRATSQIVYSWHATAEEQEPSSSPDDPTLWWRWTAPSTGTLKVTWNYFYSDDSRGIVSRDSDPVTRYYSGSQVDLLSMYETNYDGEIAVIAGKTYYFRGPFDVWSYINKGHLAVMDLSLYVPPNEGPGLAVDKIGFGIGSPRKVIAKGTVVDSDGVRSISASLGNKKMRVRIQGSNWTASSLSKFKRGYYTLRVNAADKLGNKKVLTMKVFVR